MGGAHPSGGQGTTGGFGTGGRAAGGANGSGGSANGGRSAGGANSSGGGQGTSGASGATTVDCSATMPTGGMQHSGNSQGGSNNLAWQIWSNQGSGTLTTFSTPAFSAAWNNSGDYLGRLGFEWGNGGKTYDQYGTITAGFAFKKSGTGGGFSYIGIYGWSTNPCTEWYIVDDSFGGMPFTPYNSSQKGSAMIDGENYKLYSNGTNGTGGSRCNASSWTQHWSIRQKARQCGTITISDHFKAWDAAGMKLGNLLEAKILVETGGGSGGVDFAVANLQKTQ
jgi:endo-1,4-beta-xylanase